MTRRTSIHAMSADVLRLNPHLSTETGQDGVLWKEPNKDTGTEAKRNGGANLQAEGMSKRSRCRRKLNKSEEAYRSILARRMREGDVLVEQPTRLLRFDNGDTYTPDFVVFRMTGHVEFHEVKGGYRGPGWEQGVERFHRAAEAFRGEFRRFFLAVKSKGDWDITEY